MLTHLKYLALVAGGDNVIGATSGAPGSNLTVSSVIHTVSNILIFAVGIAAVIMIIVGGLRYTLSGGDQSKVTSAKNTIIYAVVGVALAIMAYAIVQFVFTQFKVK